MTTLTQTRLHELFDYSRDTGVFIWRVTRGQRAHKGQVAGTIHGPERARKIMIDGVCHTEARLAWLYCRGTMPTSRVFHIDKDAGNSAIDNLTLTAPPRRKTKPRNKLTQARLKELLLYRPESGVFKWKEDRSNSVLAGTRAGYLNDHGTRVIVVDGIRYPASRLAYLYMLGKFPSGRLYRIGDKDDDRWASITKVNPMPFGKPRKVAEKVRKTPQDQLDAAGWKEICKGASAPPPLVTEVPGGTVNRTAQWVWFEATKPDDCLMPHNEEVERTSVAKSTVFELLTDKFVEVFR